MNFAHKVPLPQPGTKSKKTIVNKSRCKKTHRQGAKGLLNQEYRTLTAPKRREASVDIPLKPGRSERADARANLPEHALNYMQRAHSIRFGDRIAPQGRKPPCRPGIPETHGGPFGAAVGLASCQCLQNRLTPHCRVPSSRWARSRAPTRQTTVGSSSGPHGTRLQWRELPAPLGGTLTHRPGATVERSTGSSTRTTVNRPKLASPPGAGAVGRKEHW